MARSVRAGDCGARTAGRTGTIGKGACGALWRLFSPPLAPQRRRGEEVVVGQGKARF